MLKKTITYKDLDGNDVTDDFYFGLNEAEIAKLELSKQGGLSAYFDELAKAEEGEQIIEIFEDVLSRSIGRRSEDGKRLIKNQEIRDEFFQSNAYPTLFMEFLNNPTEEMGAAFMRAIIPAGIAAELGKPTTNVALPDNEAPAYIRENRDPTPEEVRNMTPEQLQEAFKRRAAKQL